ncbi:hypothetical protein E2C01_072501 [Portunus trituberculatus]|uniref:Uncharacterized protein n=1 Tax=Portunus trituberculatus TaxID=210409 RepID=A0A5B7IAW6_PORTR|nr:hypothetical protein [Portunus trituberculatus]
MVTDVSDYTKKFPVGLSRDSFSFPSLGIPGSFTTRPPQHYTSHNYQPFFTTTSTFENFSISDSSLLTQYIDLHNILHQSHKQSNIQKITFHSPTSLLSTKALPQTLRHFSRHSSKPSPNPLCRHSAWHLSVPASPRRRLRKGRAPPHLHTEVIHQATSSSVH